MALVYPLHRSCIDQHAGKIELPVGQIPAYLLANKIGDNQCKKEIYMGCR